MKEQQKVDSTSKNDSTKLGPGGQAHHHQDQESRKPDPTAPKQRARSTPMIFTSTWPIFKFKGRSSGKKTIGNSRNGKLKKGQKSKSGDENPEIVQEVEETFCLDEDQGGQITSDFELNGNSVSPTGNLAVTDELNIKSDKETVEVSTTVKYVVQDQVMKACSNALNSVNPLNSCCLSTKGGYESDDRQSCEEYGTPVSNKHNKRNDTVNDCIQCNELSNSLDNLHQQMSKSEFKLKYIDDIKLKDINLESEKNQFSEINMTENTQLGEPATLDVTSCETMNKIEYQPDLSPRNSCPPQIMSSILSDHFQVLSDENILGTGQKNSVCKDSVDGSHPSSRSISPSVLLGDGFQTIDNDSNDQNFVEVNLFGSSPPICTEEDEFNYSQQGAKPKKKGISSFFTRNLFPRLSGGKSKKVVAPGAKEEWTPFGRIQVKEMPDNQQKGHTHPPTGSTSWKNRHASLGIASSTTALIFENRPGNLPAKNPEEELRHRLMYDQMVKEAKKKEKELAKQLAKNHVQQAKLDQKVHNSLTTWNRDILPCFESVRNNKKTKELWWNGIPPSVRGKVWIMAIGNELNITHELFEIFKDRAKDTLKLFKEPDAEKVHKASREASMELIKLDVSRTFPHLCIFQKGGPYHNMLHGILGAYACYRPDVGYVQGMSFIAAVFLLNLELPDAFICFSNLMNKPCQMSFFRLDQTTMQAYFSAFEEYFQDNLPQLYDHFQDLEVTPDLYIIDWMYTLYSKSLPLDVACRVWDVFFRDGEEFLFRTALGILHLYQNVLLGMDFIHIAQFLTKLPETIASGSLFKSIASIDIHQKKFSQVLAAHLTNQQQQQQPLDS